MATKSELRSAEQWWAEAATDQRQFFRELGRLIEGLAIGQVLEVSRPGQPFELVLRRERAPSGSEASLEEATARVAANVRPEEWWASLPPGRKFFYLCVERVLRRLHGDIIMEVRNTGDTVKVALSCAEPQPERAWWN